MRKQAYLVYTCTMPYISRLVAKLVAHNHVSDTLTYGRPKWQSSLPQSGVCELNAADDGAQNSSCHSGVAGTTHVRP